jgi:nicotinamidase/pyrazinamidase
MKKALIVVDVQRDFCEGGELPAAETASLLVPLDIFITACRDAETLVVFTQDWHPQNHGSFQSNGGRWPVHCVANSHGAELMPPLIALQGDVVVVKGVDSTSAGYSAFGNIELDKKLRVKGIDSIGVCGIATEYCVKSTALDAQRLGYKTYILVDLIRSINHSDAEQVLHTLQQSGIELGASTEWLRIPDQ